jgi:hypothetical protein
MEKRARKVRPRDTKLSLQSSIQGVVKVGTCKHCGHHEIGIVTKFGEVVALKPGMKITVSQGTRRKG